MNSSLEKLVKNLTGNDLKYLVEKFGSENLDLLIQKGVYPYEYMDSFEKFKEKNCLTKNVSLVQQNNEKNGDNNEKLDGHIND